VNASAVPAHLRGQEVDVRWVMRELLDEQRVTQEEFNVISTTPRENKELNWHPLQVVAKYRLVDRAHGQRIMDMEFLSDWLAAKSDLTLYHIDPLKVDVDQVTRVMSYAFAERHGIVAVESHRDRVVVACDQPFKPDWQEHLKQVLGDRSLDVVFANPEQLRRYRIEFYNLSRSIAGAARTGGQELSGITNFEQLLEVGKGHPDADDQHIVNIVDWILQYAFSQRASDIHLEPRRDLGKMRFRIDGVLHDVYELPATIMAAVTSRLKILSRLNVAEKRKPQDGRLKTKSPDGDEVELRISTLPTAFGEKMVMRVFDPDVLVRSFSQLGFSKEDYQHWQAMTAHTHGIVFVTGPTGSGKTTTLYSTLKQLATSEVNVCTIEDPIEMVEPSFNQMQVQANIDVSFSQGVKAMLRQDPDIIMIGEIRDLATADMAIQAALTGHLVLSTLHTNGDRRHGPAPGAHPVPALQDRNPARRGGVARAGAAVQNGGAGHRLPARGLSGMSWHRLSGAHGRVRDHAPKWHLERHGGPQRGPGGDHPPGGQGGHEAAAHQRCAESRQGPHHHRRGAARHPVPGRAALRCFVLAFSARPVDNTGHD
jgi:general secretion pathway protein E